MKKLLVCIFAVTMILGYLPENVLAEVGLQEEVYAEAVLNNPKFEADPSERTGQKVTWDCIWLGTYPQTEIVNSASGCGTCGQVFSKAADYEVNESLYNELQNETGWDSNGDVTLSDGTRYRRIKKSNALYVSSSRYGYYSWQNADTYHYFRYDKIKWRVLHVSDGKAYMLADKVLEFQKYYMEGTTDNWETSNIRSWLNGYGDSVNSYGIDYRTSSFIGKAFSSAEQGAILETALDNQTDGDKLFLLSMNDLYGSVSSRSYGFYDDRSLYDFAKTSKSSTYAKALGSGSYPYEDPENLGVYAYKFYGNASWCLRSSSSNTSPYWIGYNGTPSSFTATANMGIRPAFMLDISSNLWTYAGTVCSDGTENGGGSGGDDPVQRIDYKKDTWSFENPLKGGVSYKIYKDMLRDSSCAWMAWKVYEECDGGLCYGMAQTVLASYLGYPNVEYYRNPGDTSHPVSKLNQVESGAYNYDIDTSAIDLIRHAFVYQFSSNAKKSTSKKDDLDGLYEAATNFQNDGKEPVAITITWGTFRNPQKHALAVLGGVEKCEYGYRIKVYDCNFPGENVYIYLYGTPGHFTKWWESYGDGYEVHASDDSHNTHIKYLSVTDDIISKFEKVYGQSIKSSSTSTANDEDGILIALDVSSQGVLNYNGESVRVEEIYESELENISPVIIASDNEAEEQLPVLCWLFGDDKKVTVTGMAENNEVSVVGNGAVITAKSSNTGDICIDASDNSILINGEKGADFIASYDYVGEETVKTVEATGVIESTVEIVPENDEVNVTGASGVQINETTIDLPSEDDSIDDPCANGHTWNTAYTVDVPATESAAGSQSIHCSVCGAIKEGSSQVIPQLTPSTPDGPTPEPEPTPTPAPSVTPAPQAPAEIQDLPAVKMSKPAAAKKSVNVKWKKVSKKNQKKIQGIEIQVATDPDFTNLVKTATAGKKKTSKKIKGLTSKQTYYVRIRAYKDAADGKHVSAWKAKKVKIK